MPEVIFFRASNTSLPVYEYENPWIQVYLINIQSQNWEFLLNLSINMYLLQI